MLIRYVFIFFLISLLLSCTSKLPKALEDGVVLTKDIRSTRFGEWANLHSNDLARWNILDVEEYGYIPNDYFVYNHNNRHHKLAKEPLGIRTMTSESNLVSKMVSGELAGKLEYWLAREVSNIFYEKVYEEKTLKPVYQPDPKKSGEVFYFQNIPSKEIVRFSDALLNSGINDSDVPKIIKSCSYINGWNSLTHLDPKSPKKHLSLYELKRQKIKTQKFYQGCFGVIVSYSPFTHEIPLQRFKLLPPMFAKSKYLLGGDLFAAYGNNIIKQVIDYNVFNEGFYDAGLLSHLRGKFGMDIRENLADNAVKSNLYRQAKPRVIVLLKDTSKLLSESNFVNNQYFYTVKSHMNFTSHILNKVFNKKQAKSLYLDYHSRVKSLVGTSQYGYHYEDQNVLNILEGKCNFDLSKVQLAYREMSRFEMDCLHAPIKTGSKSLDEDDYKAYTATSSVQNAPPNVLSSHVTLFSLEENGNIKGSVDTVGVNTAVIQFELERELSDMGWNYFKAAEYGGLNNGKVDESQPMSDFLSNFALTLAKNFPPSAIVSWLPEKSQYGYVFHHGILWRFPVVDLRFS